MNEAAETLATLARGNPPQAQHIHWPEQQISLIGPYGRVSGWLVTKVWYCCTATDLMTYWQQQYGWTAKQAHTVNSIRTASVSRQMGANKARRIQKLQCGWLPVNNRESQSDPDRPPGCSDCLVSKTVDHVFQCESTQRRRAILDRFVSFHSKFREHKTAPEIIGALMTGSLAWIEG